MTEFIDTPVTVGMAMAGVIGWIIGDIAWFTIKLFVIRKKDRSSP